MVEPSCEEPGCMVGATGICTLTGRTEPCERASRDLEGEISRQIASADDRAVGPETTRIEVRSPEGQLHPGTELGLDDVAAMMATGDTRLLGILGAYDAGKTLLLVSLYLMCVCGQVGDRGYAFAGSLTLPGFEDRARASRRWRPGAIPDEMTNHTVLADDRGAGFLHLDLRHVRTRRLARLLLSDLPGEWSTSLINHARHAGRLAFLRRADVILLVVEADKLSDGATRHQEVERWKMLIDRVATMVPPIGRPFGVVATKGDRVGMTPPPALSELVAHAGSLGFASMGFTVCSLSEVDTIGSGTGVLDVFSWAAEPLPPVILQPDVGERPERLFGWLPAMSARTNT